VRREQGLRRFWALRQSKYTAGSADFLVVTDAQRALYAARDQLSDIRARGCRPSVALFKAMARLASDAQAAGRIGNDRLVRQLTRDRARLALC